MDRIAQEQGNLKKNKKGFGENMRKNLKEARQRAGMTQQQMADKLGLTLGHYQKIEYNKLNGSFEVWNALEDILGIHQRILREISDNHRVPEENQLEHQKGLQ